MITREDVLKAGYMTTKKHEEPEKGLFLFGYFMHGDADHYTTSDIQMDSIEELEAVLRYIVWLNTMHHNAEISYRQKTHGEKAEDDFYAQAGEEWRDSYLWDGVIDWWPRDVTYDDIRASLEKWWIIFRDETGEYEVRK